MIYLVEKIDKNGNTNLGTDGRFIFRQYKSLKSLEKFQINKWMLKKYKKLQVSIYHSDNIYGEPFARVQYSEI